MPFVKVVKSNAYFSRYQVKYRRRREGKTDCEFQDLLSGGFYVLTLTDRLRTQTSRCSGEEQIV